MKKLKLFLVVVVLVLIVPQSLFARHIGDRFKANGITYEITSLEEGNFEVSVYDFDVSVTGTDITVPGTANDSTTTAFKVTSVIQRGSDHFSAEARSTVKSIRFSENFLRFSFWCLRNFTALEYVYLPKSFMGASGEPFRSCPKLTTFAVHADNPYFKAVDGTLYSKDGQTLWIYPAGKTATSFTVPTNVTTIVASAFSVCHNLETITIPATCTNLNNPIVTACPNLTSINVASGNPKYSSIDGMLCSSIGDTLFTCPSGLRGTITLDSRIKVVKNSAFDNTRCQHILFTGVEIIETHAALSGGNLRDVTIYPSLKQIDGTSIGGGNYFTQYILSGTNNNFSVTDGILYNKNYTTLVAYPQGKQGDDYTTNANTKIIGYGAFYSSHYLKNVTITNQVEEFKEGAFRLSSVTSIVFQETAKLKTIRKICFNNSKIESITLPASLEEIEINAFLQCSKLNSISFKSGSKLSSIGNNAFRDCSNLTTFQFLDTHVADKLTIGDQAFSYCSSLVGASAANGFVFPKNVTKIGQSAFNGCESLTKVSFDNNAILDTIGFCAFQHCGLLSVNIPKSVKSIENEAFNSCQKLTEVKIPAATTYVGAQAFLFCGKLTKILVDKNNAIYSSCDGMLASKDKKTLYSFPAGKSSTYYTMLSPSFEVINDSAFYYCRDLKSVTIPKKVTKIGAHAFAICNNLERINFLGNDPITDVHEEAFVDMDKNSLLENINIYVRKGHANTYAKSDIWGSGKVRSINESFVVENTDEHQKAEYFPLSPTEASLIDVHSDVTTFVVPERVPEHTSYKVKLIGDYAFEDCTTNIEEVVVPGHIVLNYVGARAFIKKNTALKPIKSVFIVGSTPTELATSTFGLHDEGVTGNYDEVESGQMIYVKKAATANYKRAWYTLANLIDYKIPGISINNTYGTFAREFDVDLADYFAEYGTGKIYAFTSAPDQTIYEGAGDGNVSGTWYIKMYSINENLNGDGTYIPANTGVMLKSMGGAATPTESAANGAFYYTIGDSTTVNTNVSSVLVGVTVRNREVKDPNKDIYVMSGGVFKPLNGKTVADFPVHKAYLQLPSSQYPGSNTSGAKLVFLFDNIPTEINAFEMDEELKMKDESPVYDLQGRIISTPQKGVYIKNGRKMIVK